MLKPVLLVFGFAMAALSFGHYPGMFQIIPACDAAEIGQTQTSDERGIKVTILRKHMPANTKTLDFEVTLETHTQDLGDDLTKSFVLNADGKQYLPLIWKGSPPGGHHRKGLLRFTKIVPQPQSMELQIRLSGDSSPRSFTWLEK